MYEELTTSHNPFGIVVLAYLKTRVTRTYPEDRLQWKLRLFKLLYKRGYSKEDIVELMRFIDWIMVLPEALTIRFDEAVFQYEEERRMKYVTSFERHGIKKGIQQDQLQTLREAIGDNLEVRFDQVPETIVEAINAIDDLPLLKQLHRDAVTVSSLDEFVTILDGHTVAA